MIEVLTGLPGFGKTLTATRWAYKKMQKGKKVYANYPLKGAEFVEDVFPLLGNVKNALIIVDEAGIVFDQLRMYQVPSWIWMELRQHRHDGVDLLLTAQSILDIAYPMRRLIQFEWNIYFKMWRFVSVLCRNPQPRGDSYGKRLWYISPKVYDLYSTHYKVNQDENPFSSQNEGDNALDSSEVFNYYKDIQSKMLFEALKKQNT